MKRYRLLVAKGVKGIKCTVCGGKKGMLDEISEKLIKGECRLRQGYCSL